MGSGEPVKGGRKGKDEGEGRRMKPRDDVRYLLAHGSRMVPVPIR
jgi:hypothetical protein